MPLLILLQFRNPLLKLAGNGLISLALGIGKFGTVGLELVVNAGHGLRAVGFKNRPANLTLNSLDPGGRPHPEPSL
jgi:hypothetical protein